MRDHLTRVLGGARLRAVAQRGAPVPVRAGPPRPDRPLFVVGDIHGAIDLLDALLPRLDAWCDSHGLDDAVLVFVGDAVDRGEHSRAVLERLHDLSQGLPDHVVCLMGNHERMMLDFLDAPGEAGPRWLRNGGLQTLASFGLRGLHLASEPAELGQAARALRAALRPGLEDWLRALPLIWQSGNVCVCHAGTDVANPPDRQDEKMLVWGRGGRPETPRADGLWVVHGHHVVDTPVAAHGHVAVDAGACFTGRLAAAAIHDDQVRFITAQRG